MKNLERKSLIKKIHSDKIIKYSIALLNISHPKMYNINGVHCLAYSKIPKLIVFTYPKQKIQPRIKTMVV